jgi:hypothetical protein
MIGQSYLNLLSTIQLNEETFINVVEGWITLFEKDIDVM